MAFKNGEKTFQEYLRFLVGEEKRGAKYQCCKCNRPVRIVTFGFYCPSCIKNLHYEDVVKVK